MGNLCAHSIYIYVKMLIFCSKEMVIRVWSGASSLLKSFDLQYKCENLLRKYLLKNSYNILNIFFFNFLKDYNF